jgi:hypothetical protein
MDKIKQAVKHWQYNPVYSGVSLESYLSVLITEGWEIQQVIPTYQVPGHSGTIHPSYGLNAALVIVKKNT